MTPEPSSRIQALLAAASRLSGEDRHRFLDLNCPVPQERIDIESLLDSGQATVSFDAAIPPPPAPGLQTGDKFGRYEIQALLGAGGAGKVYRAFDPSLRRPVAIKVLSPAIAAGMQHRRRFAREAETASSLNHPNIVTVYEIGVENGIDYIAMEYIPGKSLRDEIPSGGLSPERYFPWAIQIADALAAAHEAGVIHRDLKPGNVMITGRDAAKVVDFGLAKASLSGGSSPETSLTAEGAVVGTVAYMAPEQAEGKDVDARADVFSFGCLLYEMISGQRAFSGESKLSTLSNVLTAEPRPLREVAPKVPAGLERIVYLCLRKQPAQRWHSAADLRFVLEHLRQESPAASPKPGARSSRSTLLAAIAAGVLLSVAAFSIWQKRAVRPAPDFRTLALTSDANLNTAPAISSDGKLLAFASDRSGEENLDIWIQQIGVNAPVRLTSGPADESDPDISPDGTRIVFRSELDGGGIYTMGALGGQPLLLAQGGRNPRFSPDGRNVAYWTGREGASLYPGSASVFVIPVGGGQPVRAATDLLAAIYPVWSPSGNALLVAARKTTDFTKELRPDWWVAPFPSGPSHSVEFIAASIARRLGAPINQNHLVPLAWPAGEGGRVLFKAQLGDVVNIWSVPLDPANPRSAGVPSRVTSGTGFETHATLGNSPQGQRLAYTSSVLQFDLYSLPLDTESATPRGALQRITADLSPEFYPSMPADGARIAFSTRRGGTYSLCLREVATGRETVLLNAPGEFYTPHISGDGNWIFFNDHLGNISRVSTRGGAVSSVCKACGSPSSVSHDGNFILYEPVDPPDDIRALDVPSGRKTAFVSGGDRLFNGELSHDGKWVVFTNYSKDPGKSQVFVARVENGKAAGQNEWIPVTELDANNLGAHWSPKSNVVYFLSDRDGSRCLWGRRLDPASKKPLGPPVAIQHFHHARQSLGHLRSLDDRTRIVLAPGRILCVLGELTGNIWLRQQRDR